MLPPNGSRDPISVPQSLSPLDPLRTHPIGGVSSHLLTAHQAPPAQSGQATKQRQGKVEPPLIQELGQN
eukprot:3850443-Heterocapsa_arctica.AAC.1